jgi:hypothetical protein
MFRQAWEVGLAFWLGLRVFRAADKDTAQWPWRWCERRRLGG